MMLKSMVSFVLEQRKKQNIDNIRRFWACEKYAKFLIQKLELWMIFPCKIVDDVWVVMETPDEKEEWFRNTYDNGWWGNFIEYKKEYQQAKEKCLFEGFTQFGKSISYGIYLVEGTMIEDLVKFKPLLTKTAIKQLGL